MSETSVNQRKVAMIGCGFVGSATAFALMESGLFSEMVLIDADKNRAEGEALDISHGLPFARPMKIYAGDYDDIVDAAIIIVTAGANQKPDETRLDLVQKNVGIFKSIIPEIAKRNCGGILLIVSNPCFCSHDHFTNLFKIKYTKCFLKRLSKNDGCGWTIKHASHVTCCFRCRIYSCRCWRCHF